MSSTWELPLRVDPKPLERLSPHEALYTIDEDALIFTSQGPSGQIVLAYFVEEFKDSNDLWLRRFLVAPTSAEVVSQLKAGVLSVRDGLTRTWLWVADIRDDDSVAEVYGTEVGALPDDALPDGSVMLWASLQPALAVRFVGPEIEHGRVPAGVLARAGSAPMKALGKLATFAASGSAGESGRRPEWLRRIYNLPVARVAFGSLEVSFRLPSDLDGAQGTVPLASADPGASSLPTELSDRVWTMFREGLELVTSAPEGEAAHAVTADERSLAILDAMSQLVPSSASISGVDISGRMVSAQQSPSVFHLGRREAESVRNMLREVRTRMSSEIELHVSDGLIRDLDLDRRTFVLRQPDDLEAGGENFSLDPDNDDLLDVARDAHYKDLLVSVIGRRPRNLLSDPWLATDIEFASAE